MREFVRDDVTVVRRKFTEDNSVQYRELRLKIRKSPGVVVEISLLKNLLPTQRGAHDGDSPTSGKVELMEFSKKQRLFKFAIACVACTIQKNADLVFVDCGDRVRCKGWKNGEEHA